MAGPMTAGTSALKTATSSPIAKRAEEKLTATGAAKVLGKKAGKAVGKAAPVIGKTAGILDLMLNSAPSVAEKSPMQGRKIMQDYEKNARRENTIKEVQKDIKDPADKVKARKDIEHHYQAKDKMNTAKTTKNAPELSMSGNFTPGDAKFPKAGNFDFNVKAKKEDGVMMEKIKKAQEMKEEQEALQKVKTPEFTPNKSATVPEATPATVDTGNTFQAEVGGVMHTFKYDPETDAMELVNASGKNDVIPQDSELRNLIPENMRKRKLDDDGNKDPYEKRKLREPDVEAPEVKKESSATDNSTASAGSKTSETEEKKPDYHNIISYYRTGGYGDPKTSQAKYNMGMAILDTLGKTASQISNIAMANAGKAGNANTESQFSQEQKAAMANDYEFRSKNKDQALTLEKMQKQLENDIELQNAANDFKKDFERWTVETGAKWGSDEELTENLKKFMAARQNQNAAGGGADWFSKIVGAVGTALPFLLMLLKKGK